MAPRLTLVGAHLLLLVLAVSGEGDAPRLRGSVACLDCAAGHDLSGVVVAVKCAGDGGGAGALHAAETDGLGAFDMAMPAAVSSSGASGATPCAARVLGATEHLCAPRGLAVARVVPARAPGSSSSSHYALGSRLAVFTRCRQTTGGGSAAATTMDAPDRQQGDAPRVAAPRRPMPPALQTPPVVSAPPRAGGNGSPPFGMGGGLPLIYFFPFIPIIGIP